MKPSSRLRLIAPMMKMPVVINAFSRYGSLQPERHRCERDDRENGDTRLHPTRSDRAKQAGRLEDQQHGDDDQEAHGVAIARGHVAGAELFGQGQDEAADRPHR